VACSDLDLVKAQTVGQRFGVAGKYVTELLHSDVDMIINLTPHGAHASVTLQALRAGKHVYTEKPLATTMPDVNEILHEARARNLRVGCGPDLFLGDAWQSVRQALDSELIGTPLNAYIHMLHRGIEHWFLNPGYFYKPDGMVFDWLPYPLSELMSLFGSIRNVTAHTFQNPRPRFDYQGRELEVNSPTHINAILEFENSVIVTLVISADVQGSQVPPFEIRGTHGTILGPHPFATDTLVSFKRFDPRALTLHSTYQKRFGLPRWKEQLGRFIKNPRQAYIEAKRFKLEHNIRGSGLHDMVLAIEQNRPHRCSLELGAHVLEAILGILKSAELGQRINLESRCERPMTL
jgi:predicted dehydrogenase